MSCTMMHLSNKLPSTGYESLALDILNKVFPSWDAAEIKFHKFTVGLTNTLFGCSRGDDVSTMVLFRIYGEGTDKFIDRENEKNNMLRLHEVGLAARVHASFANGLLYDYVPGSTVDRHLVSADHVFPLVAAALARLHCVSHASERHGPASVACIWSLIDKCFSLLPSHGSVAQSDSETSVYVPDIEELNGELKWLRGELCCLDSPLVFCHNDALLDNILLDKRTTRATLIDFEYAALNYQAFDIGNHFTEFAGTEDIDYSFYPDKHFQMRWLRVYLLTYRRLQNTDRDPGQVTDHDLERLYVQVNKFALLAHYFWTIWALVQSNCSKIDFDFIKFASARFLEYRLRKPEFSQLQLPSRD